MIKEYLKKIIKTTERGDAREESYYNTLSNLLDEFADSIGKKKTQVTTLPKKTDAGNPDFCIWDGEQNIVGYIEAKKPGENLDIIESSEQLKRYRKTFLNLILPDFYEFRLYRHGLQNETDKIFSEIEIPTVEMGASRNLTTKCTEKITQRTQRNTREWITTGA